MEDWTIEQKLEHAAKYGCRVSVQTDPEIFGDNTGVKL